MIENFTLDTDANPENMNKLIKAINDNSSAIGQLSNKSFIPRGDLSIALGTKDLNQAKTEGGYLCVETETIKYINKPPLTGWFTLLIYLGGTGAVFQEAIQTDGVRVSRHYNGTNWSQWKEIATTDKVILYNDIARQIDANNIRTTGVITTAAFCTNMPKMIVGVNSTEGFLYTRKYTDAFIVQTFRSIYPTEPQWTRFLFSKTWTVWEVGSGGKQEIYIPYNTGYANNDTSRYNSKLVMNGIDQIMAYGSVKKSDGSNFAAGVDVQVAILPAGWKNRFNNQIGAAASSLDGGFMGSARAAIFDGTIFVRSTVTCPCIMFTIPYERYRE